MDKTRKRDTDKVLVIALAYIHILLPLLIVANDQCAYPLTHQQINDTSRRSMQVVIDLACALIGKPLHSVRGKSIQLSKLALQIRPPLVVVLVNRLDWTPVNKAWHKTTFV